MAEERRPAINKEELFRAANDLVADGKRVTATALLDELGGGSLRTIYKYLAEWQQGPGQEQANNQETELPDSVLAAFKAAWRAATAEADRAAASVREKAAEEVKAAEGKFVDALDAIERLESQADQNAQRIEELSAKVAELEASLHASEVEKSALAATNKQLENQMEKAEKAIAEAGELRGKVEALTTQNKEILSRLKGPEPEKAKKK